MKTFITVNNTEGKLKSGRIFALDLARFFACFMVVFYHFTVAIPIGQDYFGFLGRTGVGIFFMISGAALVNSYYNGLDVKKFYLKRIKSIYIPFYIAYVIMFLIMFAKNSFHNFMTAPKWTIFLTLLGIDGYAPVLSVPSYYLLGEWFLPVIIFIYFIFPLWLKIFKKYPTATLIVISALRVALIIKNVFPFALCFNVIPALSYFTLGAYIFLLSCGKIDFTSKRIIFSLIGLISLIGGIFLNHRLLLVDTGEIFTSFGIFILIFALADFAKCQYICRVVNFISSISYEIFLTHHVIIYIICPIIAANLGKISFLVGGFVTALTILIAAYSVNKISNWKPNK